MTMITESNLQDVLAAMGFVEADGIYRKEFPGVQASMVVDFNKRRLMYPREIKGGTRNDGFDQNENFVVFECVNRLLDKGYRPENIELEKEWHLGHDAKSGRADICVSQAGEGMLFIIECKTWGVEFNKELRNTKADGGQLFSYWQQEQGTKWLVLYASDYQNGGIIYKAPTVNCSDDANFVKLAARKQDTTRLYKDARTAEERYRVWDETYGQAMHDDLIFSDDSVAYQIGVRPLRKRDLKAFSPDDSIVNRFEEILRHNNVSDKENAFNRLLALFIAKLVDESEKGDDDEVGFQYKQGTDTYESLQDRLQRLHHDGMERFMHEEIFYVSSDYPEQLFENYTGSKRKNAIKDLKDTIRKLKFYSNNDFAFKDVHNEELFYQNGKILVEMVQLFEKYRIVYPSKQQFLGDLFEQLLNKGFKQNEGQFFTPMPITRFIWDSLPVERIVHTGQGDTYPKVIDYACGAGHFLTEAVEAINHYKGRTEDNDWVRDHIFGIEKDYRLARVAKISLFMNGAGGGNIVFGDGLENMPDKQIEAGAFDILVANPPYSVKDFKQHLQLRNNKFTLLDSIGDNGGEIETLFVERIGQLLKPKGIAAVILPSSILSNNSLSYIGARANILQNFYIRAVVSLGSKTFGATGTNTVIMFLEKYNEPPKQTELAADCVDAIAEGNDLSGWADQDVLDEYVRQIGVDAETYHDYLAKRFDAEGLSKNAYFHPYVDAFAGTAEVKNLIGKRAYRDMNETQRRKKYLDALYSFIDGVEHEKLFYFSLVYRQSTVVIKAPSDNKGQKEFLGYDWSNRKGNEGIQILQPGGKLYNANDRDAQGTLARAIRDSFEGIKPVFSQELAKYGSVMPTRDMLDFSRTTFTKAIRLYADGNARRVSSKYPLAVLGKVCNIVIGGTPSRRNPDYFTGANLWVSVAELDGQTIYDTKEKITDEAVAKSNVKLIPAGTTLLSFKLSIGKTAVAGKDLYTNEAIAGLVPINNDEVLNGYLFWLFTGGLINLERKDNNAFGKSLNTAFLRNEVEIPVPPITVQQEIIDACNSIHTEYQTTRMRIEEYHKRIKDLFDGLDVISETGGGIRLSLADDTKFEISIGRRVLANQLVSGGKVPVYSANVTEPMGYIDKTLTDDFSKPSVLWGIDGDWMTGYVPADSKFYPTDHCGVLRCRTDEVNPRYLVHLLDKAGRGIGFSRTYRASTERVKSISILVPERDKQDKVVEEVNALQRKINEGKVRLRQLEEKTSGVLRSYLY